MHDILSRSVHEVRVDNEDNCSPDSNHDQGTLHDSIPLDQAQVSSLRDRPGQRGKLALVFGREYEGLTIEVVQACDASCSIAIGRLQESLSLSHAVSITLSQLYQRRVASGCLLQVNSPEDLATGQTDDPGVES